MLYQPVKHCIYFCFLLLAQRLFAQGFEHIKPLEEPTITEDTYNMSSIVQSDHSYFIVYLHSVLAFIEEPRIILSKLDLEGNTVFQKEIIAPPEFSINGFWGSIDPTTPSIAYGEDRVSLVISSYQPGDHHTIQFIFDTNGNLIHQNAISRSPLYNNFGPMITAAPDGFVFGDIESNLDSNEITSSTLHLYKSDFEGEIIWQQHHQFTGNMYIEDIICDSFGNIYTSMFGLYTIGLSKFDSNGDFTFFKRFDGIDNTGFVSYSSLAFDGNNTDEESLYIMNTMTPVAFEKRVNFFRLNTSGELLDSKQLLGAEFGASIVGAIDGNGCTALIGKSFGDGITNSFTEYGDPILINFNTDFSINWAYAYGGEDQYFSDDLISTKSDSYLILARYDGGEYLIKTNGDGTSVCETKMPLIEMNDLEITVEDLELIDVSISFEIDDIPDFDVIDLPFYDYEDRCCPGGIPVIGFDYNYSFETGLVSFSNTTVNGDEYYWNFDDGNTTNEINPEHEFTANGTYQVCLSAYNECGSDIYCMDVNLETIGVHENLKGDIKIISDEDGINFSVPNGLTIVLYNSTGQIIFQENSHSNTIKINKPIAGIYFCKIMDSRELLYSEKIIVL